MKFLRNALAVVAFSTVLCAGSHGADGYETSFTVPDPYTEGDPVAGVDGWENVSEEGNPNGLVIKSPWDSEKTVLSLAKQSAVDPGFNLRNRLLQPLEGEIHAEIDLAFRFPKGRKSDGVFIFAFDNPSASSPRIGVGLSFNEDGGLFYYAEKSRIVILLKDEVRPDSIYKISMKVNLMGRYFDLEATGLKADGSDFSFKTTSTPFAPFPRNQISQFYLWQSLPNHWTTYIHSVGVKNLQE